MEMSAASLSPVRGRVLIVLAALLWSTSGAFTKLLREDTALGLNQPPVAPLQIAAWRALFAGLALLPLLRRRDVTFRRPMVFTAVTFAAMNALFVTAMAIGTSANAIFLQYTAPMWTYLASVWLLGEAADRRGAVALVVGLAGIGLIVLGGWQGGQLPVVALALGSGLAYAGVLIGLRVLRDCSPIWLTVVNHLFSAVVLLPFVWHLPMPTWPQMAVLVVYGGLQMALPYVLLAHALGRISPQEAGTLTLLEPVLNPLWAFLVSPATERPSGWTLGGGALILAALAYRYWPWQRPTPSPLPTRPDVVSVPPEAGEMGSP